MKTVQKNAAPAIKPADKDTDSISNQNKKRIESIEKMLNALSKDVFSIKQQIKQLKYNANRN